MIEMTSSEWNIETLETLCAWAENKCHPWVECRSAAASFKAGGFNHNMDGLDAVWGTFRGPILMRALDNKLYYDWP